MTTFLNSGIPFNLRFHVNLTQINFLQAVCRKQDTCEGVVVWYLLTVWTWILHKEQWQKYLCCNLCFYDIFEPKCCSQEDENQSKIIYSGELHMIIAWRNITLDGAEWESHLKFSMDDCLTTKNWTYSGLCEIAPPRI